LSLSHQAESSVPRPSLAETSGARLAFVAGRCNVVKILPARPLKQIAADGAGGVVQHGNHRHGFSGWRGIDGGFLLKDFRSRNLGNSGARQSPILNLGDVCAVSSRHPQCGLSPNRRRLGRCHNFGRRRSIHDACRPARSRVATLRAVASFIAVTSFSWSVATSVISGRLLWRGCWRDPSYACHRKPNSIGVFLLMVANTLGAVPASTVMN
jgi:hypothetical protein